MKQRLQYISGVVAAFCLLILILDPQSVLSGARDGLSLVLYTAIPTLFPFILTTAVLNRALLGRCIPGLNKICIRCGIPRGAESIFLIGLIAGYPVAAKTISDAYESGQLDKSAARRMLGFCNNAGPAFIFGIIGPMFTKRYIVILIWVIHVLSALLVGLLLPKERYSDCLIRSNRHTSMTEMMLSSIRTMAVISAWIVIWRIVINVFREYIVKKLPACIYVIIMGACELTNGCLALPMIENEAVRFIIATCLLSFGGLCVITQIISVTKSLGIGQLILGKIIQVLFSFCISAIAGCFLFSTPFPAVCRLIFPTILAFIMGIVLLMRWLAKKSSSISKIFDI